MCKMFLWEVKVFLGKRKVDFALVVLWVQSFRQEIRLHRGRTVQRQTAVWSHIKICLVCRLTSREPQGEYTKRPAL